MKKLLFIASTLLFTACTTLEYVSYDRLQAADVNFPDVVRSVGVVNNLPVVSEEERLEGYSAGVFEGDGKLVAETFAQQVAEANYFNQVVICDSALQKQGLSTTDASVVDSLIRNLGVDLLFSLDRVQIELMEGTVFIPEIMATVPSVDAAVTPVLKAYSQGRKSPLFVISKSDTISWEATPSLTYGQILKEASEYAGSMPVGHILPYWKLVERCYFDGGMVDMRDAGVYVREHDWASAAELWKKVYDRKKGKAKMRAAFNLAVYAEMNDDYAQAADYLEEALKIAEEGSYEKHLILIYQSQLAEQAATFNKLKIQMSRFE